MNFRPVFTHMEKLIRDHTFRELKSSLCFTDSYGDFPAKMTPYKTAFVFVDDGTREITAFPPGHQGVAAHRGDSGEMTGTGTETEQHKEI